MNVHLTITYVILTVVMSAIEPDTKQLGLNLGPEKIFAQSQDKTAGNDRRHLFKRLLRMFVKSRVQNPVIESRQDDPSEFGRLGTRDLPGRPPKRTPRAIPEEPEETIKPKRLAPLQRLAPFLMDRKAKLAHRLFNGGPARSREFPTNSQQEPPMMASSKADFVEGIIVKYTDAPYARFEFPCSGQSVDLLLDTGSDITWAPISDLCSEAVALKTRFACKYAQGACRGKLFKVLMKLNSLQWEQTVGGATWQLDNQHGIVGLNMEAYNNERHKSMLLSWGTLNHPTFGFIPHSVTLFRHDASKLKTAQMYIGKPLDVAKLCIGEPVVFPIADPGGFGRWYSPNVQIFIDHRKPLTTSVLWDTGTSLSMANNPELSFPSERHLVELGNGDYRVGAIYSQWNPFLDPEPLRNKHVIVGMNFFANVVLHFNFGREPTVTICKPNRNFVYDD